MGLEDHRVRMSEKTIYRKMFGVKREAIKGGWSKFHNEDLQTYYLYHVLEFLE